jgi:DNA mismatch repair protein MutL
MGKIIVLDENTVNRIAAGEVVERPASVVKELVENSIDAGSTVINTEIRNGGISFIRVLDNGSGLASDDVEMAFERHATSKIRRADDLGSITSMGFRGEALSSTAAVSDVQMLTRTRDSVQGVRISVRGGVVTDIGPAGCPVGTSITVKELFFNTPARYKFLKKDTTEAGYVTDILSRIALAHPEISLTLTSNGKKIIHTPGNGDLRSTVFSIYGADTAKQLLEVDYSDGGIRIEGFAGKAEIARTSRTNQSIYINKRYIRSKTVTSAIDSAYSTFLMKNRYPFVLLIITVDPSNVDVNVHPSKMEVKFSNEQAIFRAVYHAVNNALLSGSTIRTLPGSYNSGSSYISVGSTSAIDAEKSEKFDDMVSDNVQKNTVNVRNPDDIVSRYSPKGTATNKNSDVDRFSDTSFRPGGKSLRSPSYTQQEFEWVKKGLEEKREAAISGSTIYTDLEQENSSDKVAEKQLTVPDEIKDTVKTGLFDGTRIIGQVFSTYVLLEGEDEIFLLDQHAAHERIRYEKLKKSFSKNESFSQMLMSVIHVDLTSFEYQFAVSEANFFEKLGFSFESFGTNSLILRSAPFVDDGLDIKGCFLEILDFVMNGSSSEKSLIADEALYRMACRSAVKANKKLDEREIRALLSELSSLENPYTCPHGRPAVFRLRRYDIEKLFKRIV